MPLVLTGLAGLALGLLLAGLRRRWVLVTVDGPSMLPALRPGERVLVRRIRAREIRTGDIVVAENPDAGVWRTTPLSARAAPSADRRWIVKRAVAVPGDPLPAELVGTSNAGASRVPPGHFVLIGDNRRQSVDSRAFGLVPADRILGPIRPMSGSAGGARGSRGSRERGQVGT
ncbi:S26 family signal peptidase [Plantactinospora sp. GCM10030261]|uniref:S26 family signal peptidase n=1 Tax=Plantactinospora sp. GCM10030261 TaxID=3273420 RepID=UPI00360F9682